MTTDLGTRCPPQEDAATDDRGRLAALFDPRSLAIVGASGDPAKWGNWIALNALKSIHRRHVFLVNRRGGDVAGHPVSTSLADLPVPPELVVLSVPEASFETAVDDALAAGSRMLVAITAGFGELGDAGRQRQARIVAKVRTAGARLLGPNCMGVTDAGAELFLASAVTETGPVGLISQSGNLGIELGLLLEREGLGFSRLVSLGNQADIEAEEVLESLVDHTTPRANRWCSSPPAPVMPRSVPRVPTPGHSSLGPPSWEPPVVPAVWWKWPARGKPWRRFRCCCHGSVPVVTASESLLTAAAMGSW